jgi:DNA-binding transcriptional regulator YiaG
MSSTRKFIARFAEAIKKNEIVRSAVIPNTKKKNMNDAEFAQLEESFVQALQHARGEQKDLRTAVLPKPPAAMKRQDIIRLREKFNQSQAVFAATLNVSIKTVQAWEQGLRVPSDAALKLLYIAQKHPDVLVA